MKDNRTEQQRKWTANSVMPRGPRRKAPKIEGAVIPEGLTVQVCPAWEDRRFRFDPPSKDWRGVISRDADERRERERKA